MKIRDKISKIKIYLPALYLALKHKKTPWFAKVIAAIALIYAISPIDIVPDFIPVVGYLDDLIILPGLIALFIKLVPKDVMAECLDKAKDIHLPKGKWYHTLPIIGIWILLIFWLLRWLKWI
jgi:uncharacterized membrane protein YkvA (DUF1232 family)